MGKENYTVQYPKDIKNWYVHRSMNDQVIPIEYFILKFLSEELGHNCTVASYDPM